MAEGFQSDTGKPLDGSKCYVVWLPTSPFDQWLIFSVAFLASLSFPLYALAQSPPAPTLLYPEAVLIWAPLEADPETRL